MNPPLTFDLLTAAIILPAAERHAAFSDLHHKVMTQYCASVSAITATRAGQIASDGRTIKQVVGHIMEWDRFMILGCGELLSGVKAPQMMESKGYLSLTGASLDYQTIDEFNAFQMEKHKSLPWPEIQSRAIRSAEVLHTLFTHSQLLNTALLESTDPYATKLTDGSRVEIRVGWELWIIVLEHEGIEHAVDLYSF